MNRLWTATVLASVALPSCSSASDPPYEVGSRPPGPQPAATDAVNARRRAAEIPTVEVLSQSSAVPPGSDAAPRLKLAFRFADGPRRMIEEEAAAYVPFRRGAALIDRHGQLLLLTPEGTRTVLARQAAAPPTRGPSGELAYAARYDDTVEVHVLQPDGRDRIVATGLASAGLLAPQADGRLVFVGTRRGGGVAGLWLAEPGAAALRCLTNCDLDVGGPLDERFIALPEDARSIVASARRISWRAADGNERSVSLPAGPPLESLTPGITGTPGAAP